MVANPSVPDVDVLVVGDDPLARHGLTRLLEGEPGVLVAAALGSSELDLAPAAAIATWDLGWDAAAGLDRFREARSLPPTLVLASGGVALDALAAGARGVLRRDADGPALGAGVRAVAAGLVALDPSFAPALAPARPAPEALSPREAEVLALLAEGLPNKLIADRLHISEHTAKFHVNAILAKLGAQSRTEAVVRAARQGWLAL